MHEHAVARSLVRVPEGGRLLEKQIERVRELVVYRMHNKQRCSWASLHWRCNCMSDAVGLHLA